MKADQALNRLANAIRESGEPVCMTTDPDAWFPEKGHLTHENRAAIEFCKRCPVRAECLAYGLAGNEVYGIFGGLTAQERRKLKKKSPPVTTGTSERGIHERSRRAVTA